MDNRSLATSRSLKKKGQMVAGSGARPTARTLTPRISDRAVQSLIGLISDRNAVNRIDLPWNQ
jgi:hypothetical protein